MLTLKKVSITLCMMIVWLGTGVLLVGTTNLKGTLSILLSGVAINVALAIYYQTLERRPSKV